MNVLDLLVVAAVTVGLLLAYRWFLRELGGGGLGEHTGCVAFGVLVSFPFVWVFVNWVILGFLTAFGLSSAW